MSDGGPLRKKLRLRSEALDKLRRFFSARGVLEVETPALSTAATTDPMLASVSCAIRSLDGLRFLHTSPEHAMKRLLAAGSGDIWQLARVFRDSELGRWHQPEFLLLEWYRLDFDEFALMDEVFVLVESLLEPTIERLERLDLRFRDAFEACLSIDPHDLDASASARLARALEDRGIGLPDGVHGPALLDLALVSIVVPQWPPDTAVFLYDYPADQAALAEIKPGNPPVAARFEVFVNGIELGNGFRELTDAAEQRRRFESELELRRSSGLPEPPIDQDLLLALEQGLPPCAGVAIGFDRLIALMLGADSLAEAINFPH